jgi:hypothetical protein
MRHFRDEAGVEWKVFLTARGSDAVSREHSLPEAFREGWLVFESPREKRRLAPIPADWETLSDEALGALCTRAVTQAARPKLTDAKPSGSAAPDPLRPKLHEAEQQLDKTLAEVCETPVASRLDTGQLIRVEESLALAAEAAKEAVSIRRKIRADSDRTESTRQRPGSGSDAPERGEGGP